MIDLARLRWGRNAPGLLTALLCVAAWELVLRAGWLQYENLPPPSAIALGFVEIVRNGQLASDAAHTLQAALAGWIVAIAAGAPLGLLLGSSLLARRYSLASIEVLRPVPGIAFAPVALLLFGFSLRMEAAVIVLPAVWPVLVNTAGSVAAVHGRLHEVGETLRLPRGAILRKIVLPAAAPGILVGARLSLALALVLAVIAEMVGNPNGLGYALVREQQALRPDLMFAYVIVIGALGALLNAALIRLATGVFPFASGPLQESR